MARRTENFELTPGKVPEIMRASWGALRDFYRVVRVEKRERGKEFAALQANTDLTPQAKGRRAAEIRKKLAEAIDKAWAQVVVEHEKMTSAVAQAIDGLNLDPTAPPEIRFSELDPAATELARLALAQHAATGRVAKLLVESQVDQLVTRALDRDTAKDGQPLFELYQRLQESGDALALQAFESSGLARVKVEASEATAAALASLVAEGREARLPDQAKELLDHRDCFDEAASFSEAVRGETTTDDFLSGRALALSMADEAIGWPIKGGD